MLKNLLFILIAASILTGCLYDQIGTSGSNIEKSITVAAHASSGPAYVPNPQIADDRTLTIPGQVANDPKGELTLKSVKQVDELYHFGGVELIIKNIKIMHFIPANSFRDFYLPYTSDNEFDFIKMEIEIINANPNAVNFTPIALLNINEQQFTWEDDFYLENLNGRIGGGETKIGNLGFIIDDHNGQKVGNKTYFMTSDVVGVDKAIINKAIDVEINLSD